MLNSIVLLSPDRELLRRNFLTYDVSYSLKNLEISKRQYDKSSSSKSSTSTIFSCRLWFSFISPALSHTSYTCHAILDFIAWGLSTELSLWPWSSEGHSDTCPLTSHHQTGSCFISSISIGQVGSAASSNTNCSNLMRKFKDKIPM